MPSELQPTMAQPEPPPRGPYAPVPVAELIAARARGVHLRQSQRLYILLNDVTSSWLASKIGRTMQLVLVAYALCISCQSVTFVTEATGPTLWLYARYVINVIFSLEAFARILCYQPMRAAWRDPFTWLDLLTIVPFWSRRLLYPESLSPSAYLERSEGAALMKAVRVLEAFGTVRLLKLCRYYEAAALLTLAVRNALAQLFIPMFMLLIMVFCFASIMFEIEWDYDIETCAQHWLSHGVSRDFLIFRGSVRWGCDVCDQLANATSLECEVGVAAAACREQQMLCTTCAGHPPGHAECNGCALLARLPHTPSRRASLRPSDPLLLSSAPCACVNVAPLVVAPRVSLVPSPLLCDHTSARLQAATQPALHRHPALDVVHAGDRLDGGVW